MATFNSLRIPTADGDIILKSNGHIYCDECSENGGLWCSHLENVMRHNYDRTVIWYGEWWTSRPEYDLMIPMFPSQALWTQVRLVVPGHTPLTEEPAIPRYEVWWHHPTDAPGVPDQWIGFLNPGEGRAVIRLLLMEHMYANHELTEECSAGHHGVAAQAEWRQYINSPAKYMEWWSVFTTGWCLYCIKHVNPDNSWDPDLVPEGTNRGVWNPRDMRVSTWNMGAGPSGSKLFLGGDFNLG